MLPFAGNSRSEVSRSWKLLGWAVAAVFLAALLTPLEGRAGANSQGRVRLSWERDGNVSHLDAVAVDTLLLYCRIESAPNLGGLGLELRWDPKATPSCFQQVNPPGWLDCGRVMVDRGPGQFNGETFEHRVVFPARAQRNLFAFAFVIAGCADPPPTTFYVDGAYAEDSYGRIDELDVVGAAHVEGGRLPIPTYHPPEHLLVSKHLHEVHRTWDRSVGTTRLLRRPSEATCVGSPTNVAQSALLDHGDAIGNPGPQDLRIKQVYSRPPVDVVRFEQVVNGVPVYTSDVTVSLANRKVVRIGNRFFPHARRVSTTASVTSETATATALLELGLPANTATNERLCVYPQATVLSLAWHVFAGEWSVFVDAHTNAILGVERAVLAGMSDADGQVWLVNPAYAVGDTNFTAECNFPGGVYQTVTLNDVTDDPPGTWRLVGPRTELFYTVGVTPFESTANPPEFIAERCVGGVIHDPHGFFSQVMTYHYVDQANQFFYDRLQIPRDPGFPLPMQVKFGGGAGYEPNLRAPMFNRSKAEDAQFLLHEHAHAIHHDQTGDGFADVTNESHALAEGGIANFFATNLLGHQPREAPATIPFEWLVWEWQTVGNGKYLKNNQLYPWDFNLDPYRAGHVFANALWDIFDYFEIVHGNCGPIDLAYLNDCVARDKFYETVIYAMQNTLAVGPSLRTFAFAMLEGDELLHGGQHLNAMVDAFDQPGWFLTENDPAYGVAFSPVAVPADTSAHGLRYLAMRLASESGIIGSSVRVDYGPDGVFTHGTQLVFDPSLNAYTGFIDTQPFEFNEYITYYVSAENGHGVRSHWPKSAPELDHATFFIGTSLERWTYDGGYFIVQPGETYSPMLFITGHPGDDVTDLNVRLHVEASRPDRALWTLRNISGSAVPTTLIHNIQMNQVSWPSEFDLWVDDEHDACFGAHGGTHGEPAGHFRTYQAFVQNGLYELDDEPADGAWSLRVENPTAQNGGEPIIVHGWELQISTSPQPAAAVRDDAVAPAQQTWLGSPQPNPFNPSTLIPFYLGRTAEVQLSAYDVAGRQVRVLIDERLVPGSYKAAWDGRNDRGLPVGSGVYFFRLLTDSATLHSKAVLLK